MRVTSIFLLLCLFFLGPIAGFPQVTLSKKEVKAPKKQVKTVVKKQTKAPVKKQTEEIKKSVNTNLFTKSADFEKLSLLYANVENAGNVAG